MHYCIWISSCFLMLNTFETASNHTVKTFSALTIAIFLSLALLLLVALITGTGSVQAPVQDVAQECLLLIGQLGCGRGHKAHSVGLHGVIASPGERVDRQLCYNESLEHFPDGTNKHLDKAVHVSCKILFCAVSCF